MSTQKEVSSQSPVVSSAERMFAPKKSYDPIDGDGAPIVSIEYHKYKSGWKPTSVTAGHSCYDFVWCETDGELCQHCSGGGGSIGGRKLELHKFCNAPKICAKLWVNRNIVEEFTHGGKVLTPHGIRALGYEIIAEPIDGNPFANARESEVEYCVQCEDYHASSEGDPCRHVKFEEGGGGYTLGCGSSEVDFNETQTSLYRLLRMLPDKAVSEMAEALANPKFHIMFSDSMLGGDCNLRLSPGPTIYCEPLGDQLDYEERFWPGVAWLHSLDPSCKAAVALTRGWIWQWQRQGWKASCVVPDATFIKRLPRKKLAEWLALDPLDATALHERPLRVALNFTPECANDHQFIANPKRCHEVILWPHGRISESMTLSVAKVKLIGKSGKATHADIFFGAVIERNDKHVSEMEDYNIVRCY